MTVKALPPIQPTSGVDHATEVSPDEQPGSSPTVAKAYEPPALPPGKVASIPVEKRAGTGAATLVGRTALGDITSERFNLAAAVDRADFVARDPADIEVPRALLDALGEADTVLLIGHVGPDGDCTGSTLCMARALEALGKTVDLCIDGGLPGDIRKLDTDSRVKPPQALVGKHWDLAFILDTSVPKRIGAVNDLLLPNVGALAIADHHVTDPKVTDFAVPDGAPFALWLEPDFPAGALMAAAILPRLGLDMDEVDRRAIYMPALAGFATDTGFGELQGLDTEYFRYFKHMMLEGAQATMQDLQDALGDFQLPQRLLDHLLGDGAIDASKLPKNLAAELADQLDRGVQLSEEVLTGPGGEPALGIISLPAEQLETLMAVGKLDDPGLVDTDLFSPLKRQRAKRLRKTMDQTAVIIERGPGDILVSLRSSDDAARRLAEHLGGGGHDRAAGAPIRGKSIAEVRDAIAAWARAEGRVASAH